MSKINFLMAMHSHQPVGNFGGVFLEAYEKAYLPFVEVLEEHPGIKISLHYSGSLLDWLEQERPEFLDRLRALVKKGQVEIIAGGYYEPILPMIPFRDALGQIRMLKDKIKDIFSCEARGAWTTERVWEPKMPSILAEAGIEFTLLDDSHFRQVGFETERLTGFYNSEEQDECISIFPTSEKLRYLMPFKLPHEAIDYFRSRLQTDKDVTISFGDDGEKFGLWPGTYKWVYTEKWLHNFFTALDQNSDWLKTMTFSEYLKDNAPSGMAYISCSSYREMLEWSGGYYRNFLIKYPEVNNMHKKMLYISARLEKAACEHKSLKKPSVKNDTEKKIQLARKYLYMGQANDAYWHGVFGGLYLNHLRSSIHQNLTQADTIVDDLLQSNNNIEEVELDSDGQKEVILNSDYLKLYFRPKGGALFEFDYKPKSLNLTNTIMRRFEAYHKGIKDKLSRPADDSNQPLSIHDLKNVKQKGLENFLFYDYHPRYSMWDHFLSPQTLLEEFFKSSYNEQGDFVKRVYATSIDNKSPKLVFSSLGEAQGVKLKLDKTISVKNKDLNLSYHIRNVSVSDVEAIFGVEFNLSVYDVALSRSPGSLEAQILTINDLWNNLKINFQFDRQTSIWYFPVETVSDSESGVEKSYQELCVFVFWRIKLSAKETFKTNLKISIID